MKKEQKIKKYIISADFPYSQEILDLLHETDMRAYTWSVAEEGVLLGNIIQIEDINNTLDSYKDMISDSIALTNDDERLTVLLKHLKQTLQNCGADFLLINHK